MPKLMSHIPVLKGGQSQRQIFSSSFREFSMLPAKYTSLSYLRQNLFVNTEYRTCLYKKFPKIWHSCKNFSEYKFNVLLRESLFPCEARSQRCRFFFLSSPLHAASLHANIIDFIISKSRSDFLNDDWTLTCSSYLQNQTFLSLGIPHQLPFPPVRPLRLWFRNFFVSRARIKQENSPSSR